MNGHPVDKENPGSGPQHGAVLNDLDFALSEKYTVPTA